MTKLITLTDADVRVLKGLVEQQRVRQRNTAGRTFVDDQPSELTQAYMAKAPAAGIAARVGLNVSKATCRVYQRVDTGLVDTGFDRVVYNASDTAITGDALFGSWQDAWGTYWANDPASGDAGGEIGTSSALPPTGDVVGNCDFATIRKWDNIIAVSGTQQVLLVYDSGTQRWKSLDSVGTGTAGEDGYITYPGGSGLVEFWFSGGFVHLSVGGFELLNCGDGCFMGGEMTGHITPLSTGTDDPCGGATFQVCLSCDPASCRSFDGWAGPGWYCISPIDLAGTGSLDQCEALYLDYTDRCDYSIYFCSGPYHTYAQAIAVCPPAGPTVAVPCCPGVEVPETLVGRVTGMTGDCACMNGVELPFVYNAGTQTWNHTETVITDCATTSDLLALNCNVDEDPDVWYISAGIGACLNPVGGNVATLVSCDPFEVSISVTSFGCGCGLGNVGTLTITET